MSVKTKNRLDPDERKKLILGAAIRLLAQKGLDGFTLEAVAREAGVALSLPRHYFGGYKDLLKAATEDLLNEVKQILLSREIELSIKDRFSAYLDILHKNPWGHHVWMRSSDVHHEVESLVSKARRTMSESMYRRPWKDLSKKEKIDARGRIGYIEAVVDEWLNANPKDRDMYVDLMLEIVNQPLKITGQV